eukprot:41062-Prymnesium_polylepis.1
MRLCVFTPPTVRYLHTSSPPPPQPDPAWTRAPSHDDSTFSEAPRRSGRSFNWRYRSALHAAPDGRVGELLGARQQRLDAGPLRC